MKTYYVVAKRFFNEGHIWTSGTYELTFPCSALSSEALQDFREQIDGAMEDSNPDIRYNQSCMITFIHEMED